MMTERNFEWKRLGFILLFGVGLSFLSILEASATHLRAGQITVVRLSGRECEITVKVFTDMECGLTCVEFGGDIDVLNFGDGTSVLVPQTDNTAYPGVPNVGYASYTITHIFPGNSLYTISYREPNRNAEVINISKPDENAFYLETQIDLRVNGGSQSPILRIDPIDVGCVGVAFSHNPGAYDTDGDSLSYELVTPYRNRDLAVTNYRAPNDPSFYTHLNYNTANETGDGPPTFSIDSIDGTLKWDAPGKAGEYNVAFVVIEWRKILGDWRKIGFVRRDMQILIEACNNERPKLVIPKDTCIVAGNPINATILGYDNTPNPFNPGNAPDNHPVKIEAFSEIFDEEFASFATVTPDPAVFQSSTPQAELDFTWNTTCEHVKDQAYLVVFKITDNVGTALDPKLGLVTFETWRIKVVAPAPELISATTVPANRQAVLEWEPYDCFEEASVQIWRRVDETNYSPANCQTGMPESLGYTLIATKPLMNSLGQPVTTYTDNGLEANVGYCYRLVAVFPLPRGGESSVSDEMCINPILTSAPVITKVSVTKTAEVDGEIRVEWTPPLDSSSFPTPYQFQLQRANGDGFTSVSPKIDDTVFVDIDADLNTYDNQYFYRVLLFSVSDGFAEPVDSSSVASSVWLELSPQKRKIRLNWNAVVPWSNQLQSNPTHEVYRGPAGAEESDMVLIDLVDVLQDGLTYLDTGKLAPGDTLNSTLEYCYRVKTRGGYGNSKIDEPLENFSQINCAMPTDEEPPCEPTIAAFISSCEEFINTISCDAKTFTNIISWSVPEGACKDDVRTYSLYEVGYPDPIKTGITDTFYVDTELQSRKRCYQVVAVDRSNNKSDKSNPVCYDNCPYYELPNVFTPNGDNCNDLFRAFGDEILVNEETYCSLVDPGNKRCARFVLKVDFTVYNRWGKKVYSYVGQQGDDDQTIYIRWDGRDEKGNELATGVYFFAAEVTYDVIDKDERVKLIKGWVHLVR